LRFFVEERLLGLLDAHGVNKLNVGGSLPLGNLIASESDESSEPELHL
jgi:hypothetical protein